MGTWLVFTVIMGASVALVPQFIIGSHPFGPIQILAVGGLFVVSGVIAAEALGRFFHYICRGRLNFANDWWMVCFGAIPSIFCFYFVVAYSVAVVAFQLNPTTHIPPFAYTSMGWFFFTALSAGATAAGTS